MIVFYPYTLHSRGSLNAVSQRREFHGALIKVNDGIGCLHPWPEFGDAPIEGQLKLLRDGGNSKVIERALRMAEVDGEARRRCVSLFEGLKIPPSHFSFDQNQSIEAQMQRITSEGWLAVKTKGSANLSETMAVLESLVNETTNEKVRLRVDFNSCLSTAEFAGFMQMMPAAVHERIDFIEDPFPYDAVAWSLARREFNVKLACDKGLGRSKGVSPLQELGPDALATSGYDFAVLKPGRRDWRAAIDLVPKRARIVITSAMDHAIGLSFAAWEAAMAGRELGARLDLCGLCTEHLFEKDVFFERLSSYGGILKVDRAGTGLGFDDVLAAIPWRAL